MDQYGEQHKSGLKLQRLVSLLARVVVAPVCICLFVSYFWQSCSASQVCVSQFKKKSLRMLSCQLSNNHILCSYYPCMHAIRACSSSFILVLVALYLFQQLYTCSSSFILVLVALYLFQQLYTCSSSFILVHTCSSSFILVLVALYLFILVLVALYLFQQLYTCSSSFILVLVALYLFLHYQSMFIWHGCCEWRMCIYPLVFVQFYLEHSLHCRLGA